MDAHPRFSIWQVIMYIIGRILADVFVSICRPFPFVLLFSVVAMFFVMYADEHGWNPREYVSQGLRAWKGAFAKSALFRSEFFLVFFVLLVLFKTLFLRSTWTNPLSDVLGGWGFFDSSGVLTFESIENFVLFIPFSLLLSDVLHKGSRAGAARSNGWVLKRASLVSAIFSLCIECLQTVLWLGTFQVSDLVYNTLGGIVGAAIYCLACDARAKRRRMRRGRPDGDNR